MGAHLCARWNESCMCHEMSVSYVYAYMRFYNNCIAMCQIATLLGASCDSSVNHRKNICLKNRHCVHFCTAQELERLVNECTLHFKLLFSWRTDHQPWVDYLPLRKTSRFVRWRGGSWSSLWSWLPLISSLWKGDKINWYSSFISISRSDKSRTFIAPRSGCGSYM